MRTISAVLCAIALMLPGCHGTRTKSGSVMSGGKGQQTACDSGRKRADSQARASCAHASQLLDVTVAECDCDWDDGDWSCSVDWSAECDLDKASVKKAPKSKSFFDF